MYYFFAFKKQKMFFKESWATGFGGSLHIFYLLWLDVLTVFCDLSSLQLCWPNISSEAVREVPQNAGNGESEAGPWLLFFRPGVWRPSR